MTVGELAAAAVVVSDNAAANLLLRGVGGPPAVTQWARGLGDLATRLDRSEPALNTNLAGDLRDTTTPHAMATTLAQACTTGRNRLRAGLPAAWNPGDKTGTRENGAAGDVAIAFPPGRAPVFVAAYFSESSAALDARVAAFAEIGRVVTDTFGGHA